MTRFRILLGVATLVFVSTADAQSAAGMVNIASRRGGAIRDSIGKTISTTSIVNGKTISIVDPGKLKGATDSAKTDVPVAVTRHPYIGAQLGYAFGDGTTFESNLVTSGSLLYTIVASEHADKTDKYRFFLPVRGNIGSLKAPTDDAGKAKVNALVASPGGLRIGIEPYVLLPDANAFIHPHVFASAGWALSSAKDKSDTTATRYLALGRISLGIAIGIGSKTEGTYPMLIEFAAVHAAFADQQYKKVLGDTASGRVRSTVTTVTVPIGNNMGFLTEVYATARQRPLWRLGMIVIGNGK